MHCASRAFSMCKAGMVTLSHVCKACWELRRDIPWGTLGSARTAVVQGSRSRHTKKKKSQCWGLVPTLCMLQGLTSSSSTDWTPFSSWNMLLNVFLKHILQFGFTERNPVCILPQHSVMWTKAQCVGMRRKFTSKAHLWSGHKNAGVPHEKLEKIKII